VVYVFAAAGSTPLLTINNPVDFAFGADGGFGKLYLFASVGEGETLTPVNQLPIADAALQACVLDEAASNGWSTVDEVTALNCANSNITDLAGLETLTDLDTLDLSGNTDIPCTDLDALELALPNTAITHPATCDTGVTDSSQQVQNLHNAQGQRVVKTVNGDANTAIHFLYDQSGQVIAEIDATTGTTLREYIYVNGQQIAIVDDTGTQEEETYFVHNDHLGTPQKITDETQAIVWDATYKPFGEVEVATEEIENNIRFPGQYADEETGLNYNYFRDYDPSTGRYVESDPIGLKGGVNTYAYVANSPLTAIDPRGTVIWKGTYVGGSLGVNTLELGGYVFTLSSECINDVKYRVRVQAGGFGAGIGGGVGVTAGQIEFDDKLGRAIIDPKVFNGDFSVKSIGFAAGAIGLSVSKVNLGGAESLGYFSWEFGVSVAATWMRNGESRSVSSKRQDCCSM
jgi:RHS repeat-associated protein